MSKIEKQKGLIRPNMKTMKTLTPEDIRKEANEQIRERIDGQTLKYHEPKR